MDQILSWGAFQEVLEGLLEGLGHLPHNKIPKLTLEWWCRYIHVYVYRNFRGILIIPMNTMFIVISIVP